MLYHHSNPYYAFTDACNAERPVVILASGQACVWYRLALASKDGDWIVRHEQAALDTILRHLSDLGARYRLGAPLALPWLEAGWSSHFEATDADGTRLRFDFVSRPPRLDSRRLAACWHAADSGRPPVVSRRDLIALKRTMRLKDYAFIGALALQLDTPEDQLAATLDAEHLLSLVADHPELAERLPEMRPALAGVQFDIDALAAAIDAEVRTARKADEVRIAAYSAAIRPWAERFRQFDLSADNLFAAHGRLCEAAENCLPTEVAVS